MPTINPATKVITIPVSDLTLVSGSLYSHNTEQFRLDMNALMDDEAYIWMDDYARRNAPVTVGGVTLAQTLEIINGWSITYDDSGAADSVRLEGSNNNLFDIQNGILNQNTMQVIPTNSAGLTFSRELEDLSYQSGRIFINTIAGIPGVTYPIGTTIRPVSNFADAASINQSRGFPSAYLVNGSLVLTTEDVSNADFLGGAASQDQIDLGTATTASTVLRNLRVTGTGNGILHCTDCVLVNLNEFQGFLVGGAIGGTLTLAGEAHIVNAHAAATGDNSITIDYQGNSIAAFIPGWEGAMTITNHSNAGSLTAIDMRSGRITLDATCTAGTIVVRGTGQLVDNSAGSTVLNETVDPDDVRDVHNRLGLDASDPVTDTPGGISSNRLDIVRTGDGVASSTLTRQ